MKLCDFGWGKHEKETLQGENYVTLDGKNMKK